MSYTSIALRLAERLEREYSGCHQDDDDFLEMDAAAELRRLHRECELLKQSAPAAPVPVFKTCSCRWKGETQVQQCTLHAAHIEAIHEWSERAKTAEAKLKDKNQ
jgi:hypothetical protein